MGEHLITSTKSNERHSIRIPLTTNADAFEDAITSELIQDQLRRQLAWSFIFVWQDASNKVWLRGVQLSHQRGQLFSIFLRHGVKGCTATTIITVAFSVGTSAWRQHGHLVVTTLFIVQHV